MNFLHLLFCNGKILPLFLVDEVKLIIPCLYKFFRLLNEIVRVILVFGNVFGRNAHFLRG